MMKHIVSLVAVLLPACTVDTPVVEGDKALEGEGLEAWCASTCDRLDACDDLQPDVCAGQCVTSFTTVFSGKSAECQAAGRRVMDCIDDATSCEITAGCSVTDEEDAACADPVPEPTICEDPFTSGQPAQGFECSVGFDQCANNRIYGLECNSEGDFPECTCLVDERSTGRFTPSPLVCPSVTDAIEICAWPIVYDGHELPPPTHCEVGGGALAGANSGDCSMHYSECSDGSEYEVRCVGSLGSVVCECSVDGQPVGTYPSATGICPFIQDVDAGRVAANAGCGFRLEP